MKSKLTYQKKNNCLTCKNQCPPAKRLITRIKDEPWTASKAIDFLYNLCKEGKE